MFTFFKRKRSPQLLDMTAVVCDDERHIVRLIEVNLERQGYRVLTCSTSSEALRLCFERLPSILVIDSDLVDPTTEEVLQALSDDPGRREYMSSSWGPKAARGPRIGRPAGACISQSRSTRCRSWKLLRTLPERVPGCLRTIAQSCLI